MVKVMCTNLKFSIKIFMCVCVCVCVFVSVCANRKI